MKTKTMMTLALLAGTAACDGEVKFDEADTTDELTPQPPSRPPTEAERRARSMKRWRSPPR